MFFIEVQFVYMLVLCVEIHGSRLEECLNKPFRGPPRGGGGTCSLVLLKKYGIFPCSPNQNLDFLAVLQNCLCSPVPFIFRLLFPCFIERNGLVPSSPKNPREGLSICIFFLKKKIKKMLIYLLDFLQQDKVKTNRPKNVFSEKKYISEKNISFSSQSWACLKIWKDRQTYYISSSGPSCSKHR